MRDHYHYLLDNISTSSNDIQESLFSEAELHEHLKKVVELTGATATKNGSYESNKHFIYLGGFPVQHIAVDNKSGTTRLYSIYNVEDFQIFSKQLNKNKFGSSNN